MKIKEIGVQILKSLVDAQRAVSVEESHGETIVLLVEKEIGCKAVEMALLEVGRTHTELNLVC